jgi:protein-disulfide isomerase
MGAARAAEAAGLQGKFWEMHDHLYENQERLDPGHLEEYAAILNLDPIQLFRDMESDAVDQKIQRDLQGGLRSGVSGTPTFFINGVRFDGDWSYPTLLRALVEARKRQINGAAKAA